MHDESMADILFDICWPSGTRFRCTRQFYFTKRLWKAGTHVYACFSQSQIDLNFSSFTHGIMKNNYFLLSARIQLIVDK